MKTKFLLLPLLAGSLAANTLAADFSCPPAKIGSVNLIKGGPIGAMFEGCTGPKTAAILSSPSSNPSWNFAGTLTSFVKTECPISTAPGPNYQTMLRVQTNGTLGVSQDHTTGAVTAVINTPMMLSAWVFVKSGKVVLSTNNNGIVKTAYSTKLGQWEQLRVCTDTASPKVGVISIRSVDPAGSDFYVENADLRQILP